MNDRQPPRDSLKQRLRAALGEAPDPSSRERILAASFWTSEQVRGAPVTSLCPLCAHR